MNTSGMDGPDMQQGPEVCLFYSVHRKDCEHAHCLPAPWRALRIFTDLVPALRDAGDSKRIDSLITIASSVSIHSAARRHLARTEDPNSKCNVNSLQFRLLRSSTCGWCCTWRYGFIIVSPVNGELVDHLVKKWVFRIKIPHLRICKEGKRGLWRNNFSNKFVLESSWKTVFLTIIWPFKILKIACFWNFNPTPPSNFEIFESARWMFAAMIDICAKCVENRTTAWDKLWSAVFRYLLSVHSNPQPVFLPRAKGYSKPVLKRFRASVCSSLRTFLWAVPWNTLLLPEREPYLSHRHFSRVERLRAASPVSARSAKSTDHHSTLAAHTNKRRINPDSQILLDLLRSSDHARPSVPKPT